MVILFFKRRRAEGLRRRLTWNGLVKCTKKFEVHRYIDIPKLHSYYPQILKLFGSFWNFWILNRQILKRIQMEKSSQKVSVWNVKQLQLYSWTVCISKKDNTTSSVLYDSVTCYWDFLALQKLRFIAKDQGSVKFENLPNT